MICVSSKYIRRELKTVCRIKFFILISAGCLALAVLSGCAHRNEGVVDYRKSEIISNSGQDSLGRVFSSILHASPDNNNGFKVPSLNQQGEPVRLVPLLRKNIASNTNNITFTNLDAVSIRLQCAFIKYYSEGPISYIGDLITKGQFESRGEVAVVVNVFQLGENGADFDFSTKGINKARVVYFDQDVEANQFLNFNNMAVYGPVTYNLKPIGFDFAVMELDLSDAVTMNLLNKLASLGGKAFPANAPGLSILNSLGETLVQKQTNDINLRYALLFDAPKGGFPDIPRATLEVGNYVFIRSEDRQEDIDWEQLLLDENTGRLYIKKYDLSPDITDDMKGSDYGTSKAFIVELYRANNYFTFQINKNEQAAEIDMPTYDFGTFIDGLQKSTNEDNKNLSKVLDPIKTLVKKRVQIALFDEARVELSELSIAKLKYEDALKAEDNATMISSTTPGDTTTIAAQAAKEKRASAESDLLRQFNKLWIIFESSLDEGSGICTDYAAQSSGSTENGTDTGTAEQYTALNNDQCNYVLEQLQKIVQVSESEDLINFQSDKTKPLDKNKRKNNICHLLFSSSKEPDTICGESQE